jgi:hypothetical protein
MISTASSPFTAFTFSFSPVLLPSPSFFAPSALTSFFPAASPSFSTFSFLTAFGFSSLGLSLFAFSALGFVTFDFSFLGFKTGGSSDVVLEASSSGLGFRGAMLAARVVPEVNGSNYRRTLVVGDE